MKTLFSIVLIICLLSFSSCAKRIVVNPGNSVSVIKTPPKTYKIVKVKGKRYYFWNGKHYKKTRRGYVFVRV